MPPTKQPASHVVSEPKYKSATKFQTATGASLSAVGDFLRQKTKIEQQCFEAFQEHEKCKDAEFARWKEAEERQQCLDMAKSLLSINDTDKKVKSVAKEYLLNHFKI
jgi:hypothetical protein